MPELNHTHQVYDNSVLAIEIEDQYNSHVDLLRFVTVDKSLVGTAGDRKHIRRYRATNGTQQLEMGQGNTKNIEVRYAEEDYRILLLQNRFPYYDEELMRDPEVVKVGVQHMTTDMFNDSQKRITNEFAKATLSVNCTAFNFDAFVDAVAQLDLPANDSERESIEVFAFVNPDQTAELRKELKDDLKYVESFVRTGYIGTVAGVNLYSKKDAPKNYIVVATRQAVTYFVKKGTEVEQTRDTNIRLNTIYSRKYFLPALTDETQAVRIVKGASNKGAVITTTELAGGKVGTEYSGSVTATGTATITYAIERGELPDGLELASNGKITGTPTRVGTYEFTVVAENAYGVSAQTFTVEIKA